MDQKDPARSRTQMYQKLREKYPHLNWDEAEEVNADDLKAAAELYDRANTFDLRPETLDFHFKRLKDALNYDINERAAQENKRLSALIDLWDVRYSFNIEVPIIPVPRKVVQAYPKSQ